MAMRGIGRPQDPALRWPCTGVKVPVGDVSVIGIPDSYRGQSPKAFVKLKPGAATFTLPELQAFLKDRLGKHEMVQALDIRDELPKTPVGKLSKKELYEEEEARRAKAAG